MAPSQGRAALKTEPSARDRDPVPIHASDVEATLLDGLARTAALEARISELTSELERRATQDKRMRASAALRAVEARSEASELRTRVVAAEAAIVALQGRLAEAQQAIATARGECAVERTRADAATADAARSRDEAAAAQVAWRKVAAERNRLLDSTAWRATSPLRAVSHAVPAAARAHLRRGFKAVWWIATGQIAGRLRRHRAVRRDVRLVEGSALFDADWYVQRNPDVAASGLDPALHYVTIGGPEGRDPGPRFSASRFMAIDPDAAASSRAALLHFIEQAGGPTDPRLGK